MGGTFTVLDYCILALFIPPIISGIIKGFVSQAVSLIAIIVGIWAAYSFSDIFSPYLKNCFRSDSSLINLLSFAIIFIVILIIGYFAGKLASKFIKLIMLGWLDKLLGALFAIIKCAVIISVLIYILNSLNTHLNFIPQSTLSQSKVYTFVGKIAPKIYPYFEQIPGVRELMDI